MTTSNTFSVEEKAKAFDRIAALYYNKNFGTLSKTDFETILFDIYIEHLLDKGLPFDDYVMSKQLGLTQSRIRTLKMKKELRYPRKGFKWEEPFADAIKSARYDETSHLVKMNIADVNVLTELRYFMECQGWYDEYQLNPKLFQCRIDFFIELCGKLCDGAVAALSDDAERTLKALKKTLKDSKPQRAIEMICDGAVVDGLKELAITAGKDVLCRALKYIPFGGVAETAVGYLIDVLSK